MSSLEKLGSDAKLTVRIELGDGRHLGPGKVVLLERIGELGSISAAARSMGMSYRQAWDLIDQLNHSFKQAVVVSHAGGKTGGGASLTPLGENVINSYHEILSTASRTTRPQVDVITRALRNGGK